MMRKISMTVFAAVVAGALVGCGGGAKIAPTKEAAAEALYIATGFAADMGKRHQDPLASRATSSVEIECTEGGSASYIFDEATPDQFTISYNDCSNDADYILNGSYTFAVTDLADDCGDTACSFAFRFKGKVTFDGEINDFVDFDVVYGFSMSTVGNTVSATLRIDGWVKTSSGTYTYDNEEVVVTGTIDAA